MSITIGIFSARQWGILQANVGIHNITGIHRPTVIHRRMSISLGKPISNVTLGNGLDTYSGGWPGFSINRDNGNHLKLRFNSDDLLNWYRDGALDDQPENVDGLDGLEFNLIYNEGKVRKVHLRLFFPIL